MKFKKIDLLLFILFVTSLVLKLIVSPIVISLMIIWVVVSKREVKLNDYQLKTILFLICPYAIFLFSLIYSIDTDYDKCLEILLRELPIVIFPFIFCLMPKLKYKEFSLLMTFFSLSLIFCFIYFMFLLFHMTEITFIKLNILFKELIIHPTYYGMFIVFAIAFHINYILKVNASSNFFKNINHYILSVLLFFILFFISSKINYIALIFVVFYLLIKARSYMISFVVLGFVLLVSLFNVRIIKSYDNAYRYVTNTFSAEDELFIYRSELIRLKIWDYSIQLIKKKPMLGYGIGNTKELLNREYRKDKYYKRLENLDSHNQFLDILLKVGVFGFLVIMLSFIQMYRLNKNNKWFVILCIIILTNGLTENVLFRQRGVMFYSFFLTLTFMNNLKISLDEK